MDINGLFNITDANIHTGAGSIVTVPVINTNVVVNNNLDFGSLPLYPQGEWLPAAELK